MEEKTFDLKVTEKELHTLDVALRNYWSEQSDWFERYQEDLEQKMVSRAHNEMILDYLQENHPDDYPSMETVQVRLDKDNERIESIGEHIRDIKKIIETVRLLGVKADKGVEWFEEERRVG